MTMTRSPKNLEELLKWLTENNDLASPVGPPGQLMEKFRAEHTRARFYCLITFVIGSKHPRSVKAIFGPPSS